MPRLYQSGGFSSGAYPIGGFDDLYYDPSTDGGINSFPLNRRRIRNGFRRTRRTFNDSVREPLSVATNFLAASQLSSQRPSLLNSAVLGGVSGGLSGGIPGLLLGGVSGLFNAGNRRTAEDELDLLQERRRFANSTVPPTIAKDGGEVTKRGVNGGKKKSNAVNKTGYKSGTKTSKRPFNIIPGNHITMRGVNIPILAIPDKGEPLKLNPGDRDVKFKGARSVLEIPSNEIPSFQSGSFVDSITESSAPTRSIEGDGFDVDQTFMAPSPVTSTSGIRRAPSFNIPTDTINSLVLGGADSSVINPLLDLKERGLVEARRATIESELQEIKLKSKKTLKDKKKERDLMAELFDLISTPSRNEIDQNISNHIDEKRRVNARPRTLAEGSIQLKNGGKIPSLVRKYEEGGFANRIPIQTEEGETVVIPNLMINDVAATEKHKDMDDDEITDIVPEGSYIFSHLKSKMVDAGKLKDHEDILGIGVGHYDEHMITGPEELRLSDIVKKKATFADASREVKKYYPTRDKDCKDIFTETTNKDNLDSRIAPIAKLVELQEKRNAKKRRKEQALEPLNAPVPIFQQGGAVNNDIAFNNAPLLELIDSLNQSQFGAQDFRNEELERFRRLRNRQRNRTGLGLAANTAFSLAQDVNSTPFLERARFINERFRGTPLSILNQQAGALRQSTAGIGRDLIASGVDPARIPSLIARQTGQSANAVSRLFSQTNEQNNALRRGRFNELNRVSNQNAQALVNSENDTRINRNRQIQGIGRGVNTFLNSNARNDERFVNAESRIESNLFNNSQRITNAIDNIRLRLQRNQVIPSVDSVELTPRVFDNSTAQAGSQLSLNQDALNNNLSLLSNPLLNNELVSIPEGVDAGLFSLSSRANNVGNNSLSPRFSDRTLDNSIQQSGQEISLPALNSVSLSPQSIPRLRPEVDNVFTARENGISVDNIIRYAQLANKQAEGTLTPEEVEELQFIAESIGAPN